MISVTMLRQSSYPQGCDFYASVFSTISECLPFVLPTWLRTPNSRIFAKSRFIVVSFMMTSWDISWAIFWEVIVKSACIIFNIIFCLSVNFFVQSFVQLCGTFSWAFSVCRTISIKNRLQRYNFFLTYANLFAKFIATKENRKRTY